MEDLPAVKRFLDKVALVNGEHQYQNVVLYDFVTAKEFAKRVKNGLIESIKKVLEARLEATEGECVLYAELF